MVFLMINIKRRLAQVPNLGMICTIAMTSAIEYFLSTLQEEKALHINISTNGFPICQVTD